MPNKDAEVPEREQRQQLKCDKGGIYEVYDFYYSKNGAADISSKYSRQLLGAFSCCRVQNGAPLGFTCNPASAASANRRQA